MVVLTGFHCTLKKRGSVGQWEMNQFIGMGIQEMKADQKYSKVVGIKGGGGVISMKLKEQLRGGGYINEINEFQIQFSSLSKKKAP